MPKFKTIVFDEPEHYLRGAICLSSDADYSIGGCRVFPYADLGAAVSDAQALSRAMLEKSRFHQLAGGGAKAALILPEQAQKQVMYRRLAHHLNALQGKYYTSMDIGTSLKEVCFLKELTPYVLGGPGQHDPAYFTALGVKQALKAACHYRDLTLDQLTIAIEGVGQVGQYLVQMLAPVVKKCLVCDTDEQRCQPLADFASVEILPVSAFPQYPVDVLMPCAIGGTITANRLDALQPKIVCGAANNQLSMPAEHEHFHQQGITVIPDYVANGGGVIFADGELHQLSLDAITAQVEKIYERTLDILTAHTSPLLAAQEAAYAH